MEHEGFAPRVAGTGIRLAAPALRARRNYTGTQPSLHLAGDFSARDWGERAFPSAAGADEAGLWLDALCAFVRLRWTDCLPILRNGAVIGAMGAVGFGMALTSSQPGLMKRVDRLLQPELGQVSGTSPQTGAETPRSAITAPAGDVRAPAPQARSSPMPGAGTLASPPAAPPSRVPRISRAMAAMPLPVGVPHLRAPAPHPVKRPVRLATLRFKAHKPHPVHAVKYGLPDWLTHPRAAAPRVLIMSAPPHSLVAREDGRQANGGGYGYGTGR